MEAIVMAAGEGSRMRPLSERWAKPVLPIDGRPVLASLLRELAAAGVERATVVSGHLAEQVEALVGDGSAFGLDLRVVRQPRPDGSADAVRRALAGGGAAPCLVTAADTLYTEGDVGRFRERVLATSPAGALAVRRGFVPSAAKPGVRVADGLVERIVDLDPTLPLTSAPLWALGEELVPYLDGLSGPPFELRDAFARALADGYQVAAVEIGRTRDLTRPVDVLLENFPYLAGV
jgi:NDP-sugar pyrophosphorylase family protein